VSINYPLVCDHHIFATTIAVPEAVSSRNAAQLRSAVRQGATHRAST
jgi:hypothetical protein